MNQSEVRVHWIIMFIVWIFTWNKWCPLENKHNPAQGFFQAQSSAIWLFAFALFLCTMVNFLPEVPPDFYLWIPQIISEA